MGAAVLAMKAVPYAIAAYNNRHVINDLAGKVRLRTAGYQLSDHSVPANTIRAKVRRVADNTVVLVDRLAAKVQGTVPQLDKAAPVLDRFVVPAAERAMSRHAATGGGRQGRSAPRAA